MNEIKMIKVEVAGVKLRVSTSHSTCEDARE